MSSSVEVGRKISLPIGCASPCLDRPRSLPRIRSSKRHPHFGADAIFCVPAASLSRGRCCYIHPPPAILDSTCAPRVLYSICFPAGWSKFLRLAYTESSGATLQREHVVSIYGQFSTKVRTCIKYALDPLKKVGLGNNCQKVAHSDQAIK